MKNLLFLINFIIMFSNNCLANTSIVIENLENRYSSTSTADSFLFLSVKDTNARQSSKAIDVTCVDGEIEIRIMDFSNKSDKKMRFETDSDFYCYGALLVTDTAEAHPKNIKFIGEIQDSNGVKSLKTAKFSFENGTIVDLYNTEGVTLESGDLKKTE